MTRAKGKETARQTPSQWMASRGWRASAFQRQVWLAMKQGRSGLLHAPTGSGKTYAIWLGALQALAGARQRPKHPEPALTVLWMTPMRALAADTLAALKIPALELAPSWTFALRTGDTSSNERAQQSKKWPTVLVTTPESLSLMLSQADAPKRLSSVELVVVDEWHELMGSKRGVQVQLALARLRNWAPHLMVWGLSATLGNLEQAKEILSGANSVLIRGGESKRLTVDTLLPDDVERFPWAGHLGLRMVPAVVAQIDASDNTLLFTNTRAQAELWYQAILEMRPDWSGVMALHHGSLDKGVRQWVEDGLKKGIFKVVVATSSLDLGVDFSPVERVMQIGSIKGIGRLIQRAGRSGHAPGQSSRITLVPTHSMEILEAAATRRALASGQVERRRPPDKPLDVLIQHIVTVALGGGFDETSLLSEVRTAHAYQHLTDEEWQWALDFSGRGGPSLTAYPEYRRIEKNAEGRFHVSNAALAKRHRMGIGTIVGDGLVRVAFVSGGALGSVEESFVSRLSKGDCFVFAGRVVEFVRLYEMTAYVRIAKKSRAVVPRWSGGTLPLSGELAHAMLQEIVQTMGDTSANGANILRKPHSPEMRAMLPLLELQRQWSHLPTPDTLLVESLTTRAGFHVLVYPFAGRRVHLALASLWAYRLSKSSPLSFSMSMNDYGLELLCDQAFDPRLLLDCLSTDGLVADVEQSINGTELAKRHFREIAKIAGLVFSGYPGAPKSLKQLQASSTLFFDVFTQYDAGNLLLKQAHDEVLRRDFGIDELEHHLQALAQKQWQFKAIARWTPFSFPLMVDRIRERLSSEQLNERIARLLRALNAAAQP